MQRLIEQEQEKFVKLLMDEITTVNIGTEEDPRLVQIGSTLSSEERERLVALLKDFKDVIAWSYEDKPGIDPEIVQHRIPLDPEARPISKNSKGSARPGPSRLRKRSPSNSTQASCGYPNTRPGWPTSFQCRRRVVRSGCAWISGI